MGRRHWKTAGRHIELLDDVVLQTLSIVEMISGAKDILCSARLNFLLASSRSTLLMSSSSGLDAAPAFPLPWPRAAAPDSSSLDSSCCQEVSIDGWVYGYN